MRTIQAAAITETVARLCIQANTHLPPDVAAALDAARRAEPWPLARETLEKARDLEHRFLDVMERDTEAFNAVSAVFAMPKGTDQEKEARAAAMQEALQGCTKTPFEMMELSLEALRLTGGLVDRSNASAASDLGCAALHLGSAVQGAWLNVLINLGSIRDAAFAAQYRTRGQILLDEALPLAQSIYARVLKTVQG